MEKLTIKSLCLNLDRLMCLARTRFKASTEVPCVSARTGKSSAANLTSSSPDAAERIMQKFELSALDIIQG